MPLTIYEPSLGLNKGERAIAVFQYFDIVSGNAPEGVDSFTSHS
jgi:hypothetical protein